MLAKSYVKPGNPDPENRVDFLEMRAHTFADQLLLSAIINAIALKGQCKITVEFQNGRTIRWTGDASDSVNDEIPRNMLSTRSSNVFAHDDVDEFFSTY